MVGWFNQFQKCKYASNPKLSWTYSIVVADRVLLSKTMVLEIYTALKLKTESLTEGFFFKFLTKKHTYILLFQKRLSRPKDIGKL